MIASWIAHALLAGQTELLLNKAQLAQWHVQGCCMSNSSPTTHGEAPNLVISQIEAC